MSNAEATVQAVDPLGAPIPVAEIFLMVAEELERARVLGLRIEGAICAIAVRSELDAALVSELQQLDAVLQHIAALRDYAAEISRHSAHLPKVATESALNRITLNEVRARLAGEHFDDNPNDAWEVL
ncbi:MAG: hypothetical protein K2P58_05325 [Hyphomonadaceae bacterium]|nr:hypothetical protein [Hyphomonadaceae bacterium]